MSALRLDKLRMRYGALEILKGIDLVIESGEFVVLVGPSGCGKSTLLNVVAGLEAPSDGSVLIGGNDVTRAAPKDRDIAMVFQSYALYPAMSVAGNITFGMECRGVRRPERQAALARVARLLQIEALLDRRPSQLSGGQRQRVAMGRALVRDPLLFLFDEPLSNLDAKLRVEMRMEIKRLHARLGTTMVYVTHDQVEAMTLATRIAVMDAGTVQQFADPQTIYDDPETLFVARFMGSPPMNAVPVTLAVEDGRALALLETGGETARIVLPTAPDRLAGWIGREVLLGLRPECITVAREPAGPALRAAVELVEPTGAETMLLIRLGGREVTAKGAADARPKLGETLRFAIDTRKACLFDPGTGRRIAR